MNKLFFMRSMPAVQLITFVACGLGVLGLSIIFLRRSLDAWDTAVRLDQVQRSASQRLLSPLASHFAPQTEAQKRDLSQRLIRAGLREEDSMARFNYTRATVAVSGVGLCAVMLLAGMEAFKMLFVGVLIAYVCVKGPEVWLNSRIKARQVRIGRALPSLIDLMVLCLDVGLSMEAAFERVTFEMQSMEPLMAEEARIMVNEMGAGIIFPTALKRLAERVGLEEMQTMARLISQASSLGASVTQALREYSEASFQKRLMALEEHAGKISAWLVMPLTLCFLPACLLALGGPAVVIALRAMSK